MVQTDIDVFVLFFLTRETLFLRIQKKGAGHYSIIKNSEREPNRQREIEIMREVKIERRRERERRRDREREKTGTDRHRERYKCMFP